MAEAAQIENPKARVIELDNEKVKLHENVADSLTNATGDVTLPESTMTDEDQATHKLGQAKKNDEYTFTEGPEQPVINPPSYEESKIAKTVRKWLHMNTTGEGKGKDFFKVRLKDVFRRNQKIKDTKTGEKAA